MLKAPVSGTGDRGLKSRLPDHIDAGLRSGSSVVSSATQAGSIPVPATIFWPSSLRGTATPDGAAQAGVPVPRSNTDADSDEGAGAWRSWNPRGTVNAENAGSSPVVPAKVRGLVVYRLGWETFNLSKWVQLPPRLP